MSTLSSADVSRDDTHTFKEQELERLATFIEEQLDDRISPPH